MPKVIDMVRNVAPLVNYFTKNGGLNTVTSAASTGFIPMLVELLNNPAVDQGIVQLSGGSQVAAIIASVIIAVRAGLGFYRAKKSVE